MYSSKIKQTDVNNNDFEILNDDSDDFMMSLPDPTPFLKKLTAQTVFFNDKQLFTCCSSEKIVEAFTQFLPWNRASSNPIPLPLEKDNTIIMSATILYENAEKMTHFHLHYDIEARAFLGQELQFDTRLYEKPDFKVANVLEKFGQKDGFTIFYRKVSVGANPRTLVTTKRASESAILQALDGNFSVLNTERHNFIQILLKSWVDLGIRIDRYKVAEDDCTEFEFIEKKVFTPYHPNPEFQNLTQSMHQVSVSQQMNDNSQQTTTESQTAMEISQQSQNTQTNEDEMIVSSETVQNVDAVQKVQVISPETQSTIDQHFYNTSSSPTDIRLQLPNETHHWEDELEKSVNKEIRFGRTDTNGLTVVSCATEAVLKSRNWSNHVNRALGVFSSEVTPLTAFKRIFCPEMQRLMAKDAAGNRKRVDEVTEIRRIAKNALQQFKYSTFRELKLRQAILLFAGYASHLHHHLTQIQSTVLENKQEFPAIIVNHCEYLERRFNFRKNSSLQYTFDKAYYDMKADYPNVRSRYLFDSLVPEPVEE